MKIMTWVQRTKIVYQSNIKQGFPKTIYSTEKYM